MPAAGQCAAIIPCLNEAPSIGRVVRDVAALVGRVWVIDDGSTDGTAGAAEAAGAQVIRAPATRGKGAALRTGVAAATEAGFDWVLLMDGDGQHATADIPALLSAANASGAEMVIGNRMGDASAIPWLRRKVNRWMSEDLTAWLGVEIPDSQSGFRLLSTAAWQAARPGGDGFIIESDMLRAFVGAGYRLAHVPVKVLPRYRGRSRIRALRDTIRWLCWRHQAQRAFRHQLCLRETSPA